MNTNNSNDVQKPSLDLENCSANTVNHWWDKTLLNPKDLLDRVDNWSLASDAATATVLKSLSQKIISSTQEIGTALSNVLVDSEKLSASISNININFELLSNTQFIEKRTYQDDDSLQEEDDRSPNKPESTLEDIILSYRRALQTGIGLVKHTLKQYEISDSDSDSESPVRPLTVYKRTDHYQNRRLPHIIGSAEFYKDESLGLVDLSEKGLSVCSPASSESDVEDVRMKASSSQPIKGISSKIQDDESDSDLDAIPAVGTAANNFSVDSIQHPPTASVQNSSVSTTSILKDDQSSSINGILSDSDDEGDLFRMPTTSSVKSKILSLPVSTGNRLFNEISPILKDTTAEPNKKKSIDDDTLFSKTTPPLMANTTRIVSRENVSRRGKPNRKTKKKKGLFDSSSSSSAEEHDRSSKWEDKLSTVSSSTEELPTVTKIPVGGINVFGSAITKAIQSQHQSDSKANDHSQISSSKIVSCASSSVQNSNESKTAEKESNLPIQSVVKLKSSHEANPSSSLHPTDKVIKPVRHNSLFSDEEDLFAPVPPAKSQVSSLNPVSLFDDSDDDDLFGAPIKSSQATMQPSYQKTVQNPQIILPHNNKVNTTSKMEDSQKDSSVRRKVQESTKPIRKQPVRKTPKNIFDSSSSDEDIFTPLPKSRNALKNPNKIVPEKSSEPYQGPMKNTSRQEPISGGNDIFIPPPLPVVQEDAQLKIVNNSKADSFNDENKKRSLKVDDHFKISKEKLIDNPHKINNLPFSSSSDDDIFSTPKPKVEICKDSQNKLARSSIVGQSSSMSKSNDSFSSSVWNEKTNSSQISSEIKSSLESAKSYDSPNVKSHNHLVSSASAENQPDRSSTIIVQSESQMLPNSVSSLEAFKPNDSKLPSSITAKPLESVKIQPSNVILPGNKPHSIFDDDSDEDIFAFDYACKTTRVEISQKPVVVSKHKLNHQSNTDIPIESKKSVTKDNASDPVQKTSHSKPAIFKKDSVNSLSSLGTNDLPIFSNESDSDDKFTPKSTKISFARKNVEQSQVVDGTDLIKTNKENAVKDDDIICTSLPPPIDTNLIVSKSVKQDLSALTKNKLSKNDLPADVPKKSITRNVTIQSTSSELPISKIIFDNPIFTSKEEGKPDCEKKRIPPKASPKPKEINFESPSVSDSTVKTFSSKASKADAIDGDTPIVRSPKKPIGGVALFGGSELITKLKQRRGSNDETYTLSQEQASSDRLEIEISKERNERTSKGCDGNFTSHSINSRLPSISKNSFAEETEPGTISLESGCSFDESPTTANVLTSVNKDRPRIKKQRNPPSRSKRKANFKDKTDNQDISSLPQNEKLHSDKQISVTDIFGNDIDEELILFSSDPKVKEILQTNENITRSKNPVQLIANKHTNEQEAAYQKTFYSEQKQVSKPSGDVESEGSKLKISESHKDICKPAANASKQSLHKILQNLPSKSSNLFDDDDDDELFGSAPSVQKPKTTKVVAMKSSSTILQKKVSLFSDDEEDSSMFETKSSQPKIDVKDEKIKKGFKTNEKKTSLFSDDDSEDLFTSSSSSLRESKSTLQRNKSGDDNSNKTKKDSFDDPLMSDRI